MIQQKSKGDDLAKSGNKTEQPYPADPLSIALRELRDAAEPFDEARFKVHFAAFYEAARPFVLTKKLQRISE